MPPLSKVFPKLNASPDGGHEDVADGAPIRRLDEREEHVLKSDQAERGALQRSVEIVRDAAPRLAFALLGASAPADARGRLGAQRRDLDADDVAGDLVAVRNGPEESDAQHDGVVLLLERDAERAGAAQA